MPRYKLTVLLIKEEYNQFDAVIRNDLVEGIYNLTGELQIDGVVYTGSNSPNSPEWLQLLNQGVGGLIPELTNRSTRAVLLVRWQERIFAFPCGFGRFMINDETIIKDFGILKSSRFHPNLTK